MVAPDTTTLGLEPRSLPSSSNSGLPRRSCEIDDEEDDDEEDDEEEDDEDDEAGRGVAAEGSVV